MKNKMAATMLTNFEQFYRDCQDKCKLTETSAGTEFNNCVLKAFCRNIVTNSIFLIKKFRPMSFQL